MLQRDWMRLSRIAAQEKQRLAIADIGIAVGHRPVAPGIGYTGNRRRMANARLVIGIVRAPEGREFAIEIGALIREFGRTQPIDGIGARFLANLQELVADFVDRLLPRDFLPLAVHQLDGIAQATIALHDFTRSGSLRTMRASIDRAFPARFLADPHAVLNLGDDRAADGTVRADVLAQHRLGRRRSRGLRLAYAGEGKRTQHRESTCGEP